MKRIGRALPNARHPSVSGCPHLATLQTGRRRLEGPNWPHLDSHTAVCDSGRFPFTVASGEASSHFMMSLL